MKFREAIINEAQFENRKGAYPRELTSGKSYIALNGDTLKITDLKVETDKHGITVRVKYDLTKPDGAKFKDRTHGDRFIEMLIGK